MPIYQRTYSWYQKQCYQLFEDIIKVGSDTSELTHFIGSIVYFKPGTSPVTSVPELLVIDNQTNLDAAMSLIQQAVDIQLESE